MAYKIAPSVLQLLREFLDERVKDDEFRRYFGLNKNTTTIAKGDNLRIDLQSVSIVFCLLLHSIPYQSQSHSALTLLSLIR